MKELSREHEEEIIRYFQRVERGGVLQAAQVQACLGTGKSWEGQEQGVDGKVEKDELRKVDWGQIVKPFGSLHSGMFASANTCATETAEN